MKQQRSHARIHQVILQLRQKNHQQEIEQGKSKQLHENKKNISISGTATMENSQVLSQSQISSSILPRKDSYHLGQKNLYKITSIISSESLNSQREEADIYKRQIKSARPVSRKKITSKDKYFKTFTQKQDLFKMDAKKSDVFEQLQIFNPVYFVEERKDQNKKKKEQSNKKKEQSNKKKDNHLQSSENVQIKAFWAQENIFVSLFPIQYTEYIIYNHPNILPVYGQVKLRDRRYVVSNQYKNSSLKDLIREFGPFQQSLCKKYLQQIVCGLEEMHNRKTAHNRLHSQNILYNKQGGVFINVVKSTSRPLLQKQKQEKLYQYSPQILLTKNKSNSLKSDIWSVGIILLDMLFDFDSFNRKQLKFHPYNWTQEQLEKNSAIIVDNLKQLYPKSFLQNPSTQQSGQTILQKYNQLSQQCRNLIQSCLVFNKEDRPSISALKSHNFFSSLNKNE